MLSDPRPEARGSEPPVSEEWSGPVRSPLMLRPWVLRIILRRDSAASVHRQITHAIIEEIRAGRLAPGSALPGSRKLAESLKVNRKTVVQAYDELVAQGWLAADSTRATFVPSQLPQLPNVEQGVRAPRQNRPSGKIADEPDFRLRRRPPAIDLSAARRWRAGVRRRIARYAANAGRRAGAGLSQGAARGGARQQARLWRSARLAEAPLAPSPPCSIWIGA